MSAFIFSEFPNIDIFEDNFSEVDPLDIIAQEYSQEISYFDNTELPLYMQPRENIAYNIIQLLPERWVNSFRAYEALEVLGIEDIILYCIKSRQLDRKTLQTVIEFCIMSSDPNDTRWNSSYEVLSTLYYIGVRFDTKLYALTCSNKCIDSLRILSLFCNKPAKIIQSAWLKYYQRKRDRASRLIQEKVLEWLYRPNGSKMKKAEKHFYSIL